MKVPDLLARSECEANIQEMSKAQAFETKLALSKGIAVNQYYAMVGMAPST